MLLVFVPVEIAYEIFLKTGVMKLLLFVKQTHGKISDPPFLFVTLDLS